MRSNENMAPTKPSNQHSRPPSSINTVDDVVHSRVNEPRLQISPDKSPEPQHVRDEPIAVQPKRSPDKQPLPSSEYVAETEPVRYDTNNAGIEYTAEQTGGNGEQMAIVGDQQHQEQPVYGTEYDAADQPKYDDQQYQQNYDGDYTQQQYDPNYTAEGYDAQQYDQQYDEQQPYTQEYEQYPSEYDGTYAGEQQQQYEGGTVGQQQYVGEQQQYVEQQPDAQQYEPVQSIGGEPQPPPPAAGTTAGATTPSGYPKPIESNRNVGKEYTGNESTAPVTKQSELLPKQSAPIESLQTKTN